MKVDAYMIINKHGVVAVRKSEPSLEYDQIACRIHLEVPDELFTRPQIEATLKIENIPPAKYNPQIIINTKELIEQQTGAKIEMRVISYTEDSVQEGEQVKQ